jgi:L-ascorbate metabolism protein UlaG (beta-lactamase superfamily)
MHGRKPSSLSGLPTCVAIVLGALLVSGCAAFGARATGERRARMAQSPEWRRDHFVNPQPLINDWGKGFSSMLHQSLDAEPSAPVPVVNPDPRTFATAPPSGLRVTWLGHSTTLLELDGARILTDPVWSLRISPVAGVGPTRWYPPPIALADLPPIDAVVISHDHYDHLDYRTIVAMKSWKTAFIVPLGVGAHLARWGIPETRIIELDWWQRAQIATATGTLEVVCTPARHASGRTLSDSDAKLWAGYAFIGAAHRVYFSGDSGLFPALADIGARLGPFDLTMIEIGQYDRAWPDWHMGPEQAVRAHQMVHGRVFLPVHWAAISLAAHAWTEPIERAVAAARLAGVTLLTPRPGASVQPSDPPPPQRWWPRLRWRTAAQDPIVSGQMN